MPTMVVIREDKSKRSYQVSVHWYSNEIDSWDVASQGAKRRLKK